MRREREQVLREAIVDLPRDAGSLLGDRPADLGVPDGAPGADEHQGEGEQA